MNHRNVWLGLLDAALDQPHPTQDLKAAIEGVLRRDPVVLKTPAHEMVSRFRRHTRAEQFLDGLARAQRGPP